MKDPIERQDAIDAIKAVPDGNWSSKRYVTAIKELSPAQPETLTDNEKRIFLAAMTREELICLQLDEELNDPNLVNLVEICHEITRKVKGALWT